MLDQSNAEPSVVAQFWLTMAFTVIPGILGGIVNGISMFLKEIKVKDEDWPPNGHLSKPAFFLAQALLGMGGALAALLVTLWANRFPDSLYTTKAWLTLVCTGFVAGYVANRLLPAIADSLYNRLIKLDEKTEITGEKAEAAIKRAAAAEKQVTQAVKLTTLMIRASDYLKAGDFSQRLATLQQIHGLTELAESFPTNRTLNILLARLHAEADGDFQSAIQVLNAFIEAKVGCHEDQDEHTADAYWNLASYYEDEGKKTGVQPFRSKAVEALRQSIRRVNSYYNDLMNDGDFKDLRESEEGEALLRDMQPLYEQWKAKHADGASSVEIN